MKRSISHIFVGTGLKPVPKARFLFCLLVFCFFTMGQGSTPKPPPPPPPAVTSWWLSLDLGKTSNLSKLTILWDTAYGSTDYTIQGSNNNNTWTNLLANQTSAGAATKEHTLTGSYRYVRIYINKAQNSYPIIYEVKLYGREAEPPPPAVASWWLSLDLSKTAALSKISILWDAVYGSTDYSIQGSNDNNTWANLLANQSSAGSTTKDHALSGSYRYVRVQINKAAQAYPIIYEVKLYGSQADTIPPVITISPVTSPTNQNVTLSYTVSDNLSPAYKITVSGDSSPYTQETSHNVTLTAKDEAGNTSDATVSFVIDKTPPVIVITSPVDKLLTNQPNITVNYTVDGQTKSEARALNEGDNTLTVGAADLAGNSASKSITVTLDSALPTASISSPGPDAVLSGPVEVRGLCDDANWDRAYLSYSLHETADSWITFDFPHRRSGPEAGLLAVWDTTNIPNGKHFLKLEVVDLAGNVKSVEVPVKLSNETIYDNRDSPDPFSPNNDGRYEVNTISAMLTADLNWTISIKDAQGSLKRVFTGSGIAINQAWDGKDTSGAIVPDGAFTYIIGATDATGGAYAPPQSGTIYVDNTAPAVSISQPKNEDRILDTVAVQGTATDTNFDFWNLYYGQGASPTQWNYLAGGGEVKPDGQGNPGQLFVWDVNNLPNGDYVLRLIASDSAGNETALDTLVGVGLKDTTPPVITINPVASPTNQNVTLSYSLSDNVSAADKITVSGDNSPYTQEGSHNLTLAAKDEAGNTSGASVSFVIDKTPPVIAITSPADNSTTNQKDITINYTVDGQAKSENRTLTEGANTLTVTATDPAGNSASKSISVTLDTIPPEVVITSPADNSATNQKNITINYTVDGQPKSENRTLTEGLNTLTITAADPVGNTASKSIQITLDTIAPEIIITSPQNNFLTNQKNITINYTVDGEPKSEERALNEGANTLTVNATDAAGNSASKSVSGTLDSTAIGGTLKINNDAAYTKTADVTLTLSAQDSAGGSGISQMQFSNDGLTWSAPEAYAVSKSWALLAGDGEKIVYAKFSDTAGNWSAPATDAIMLDTTAPVIVITSPADNSAANQKNITVNYTVDGQARSENRTLTEGLNTLTVNAADPAGNMASASLRVTLDSGIPTGTLKINNDAQYTNSASITLNLSAQDNDGGSGIFQMRFSNDGATWSDPEPFAVSKSWALPAGDGDKTAYAKFSDVTGNWSTPVSDTITLDTTAPVVVITSPADNFATNQSNITVNYTVDGQPRSEARTLNEGANTLTVSAADPAGNSSSRSIKVIKDTAIPDAPQYFYTNPGYKKVTLYWAANSEKDLAGYNIYRRAIGSNHTRLNVSLVTARTYVDTDVIRGADYYYVVTAVDTAGNESGYSNEARGTPPSEDNEAEPNDDFASANPLSLNHGIIANITPFGETDYYKIDVLGPGRLSVILFVSRSPDRTTHLVLLDENQNVLNDEYSTTSNTVEIDRDVTSANSFYIKVVSMGTGTAAYTYNLDVNFTGFSFTTFSDEPDPFSPNNDGQKDVSVISAAMTTPSNWAINIKDGQNNILRTFTGSGTKIEQAWDGKNSSGATVPDGVYTYIIEATDQASGSNAAPVSGQVTVDSVAPTLAITSPADNSVTTQKDITINYTVDGQARSENRTLTEGANIVTVTAGDLAGNTASKSIQVTLDTIASTVPQQLSAEPGDESAMLSWIANSETDLAGYNIYRSQVSGSGYLKLNSLLVSAAAYQDAGLTNGVDYFYVVTAVDIAGHESAYSNEAKATAGTDGPYEIEPNNDFDTANALPFRISVKGNINPQRDWDYFKITVPQPGKLYLNLTGLASSGIASVYLYNQDRNYIAEGNRDSQSLITLDKELPSAGVYYIRVFPSPSGLNSIFSYRIRADLAYFWLKDIDVSPGVFSPNADGKKDTTTFYASATAPCSFTINIKNSQGNIIRTFTGLGTKIEQLWDGKDSSGVVAPDGIYTYTVDALDNASGASALPLSGQVIVDNTLPTALITDPSAGASLSGIVSTKGTADDANFKGWLLYLGRGAEPTEWQGVGAVGFTSQPSGLLTEWGASVFPNGDYVLKLIVTDNADNTNEFRVAVKLGGIAIYDVSHAPDPFSPNSDGQKDVSLIKATMTAPSNWTINIKDGQNNTLRSFTGSGSAINQSWDGKNSSGVVVPDGVYTYIIEATDQASGANAAPVSGQVTIDSTFPVGSITAPASGEKVSGKVGIYGTATDAHFNYGDLYYKLDESAADWKYITSIPGPMAEAGWLGEGDTSNIPSGAYSIRLRIFDYAGNITNIERSVTVYNVGIYNVSATPAYFSPNADGQQDATNIRASITALCDWTLKINAPQGGVVRTFTGNGTTIDQPWDGKDTAGATAPDGVYTYTIDATDPATGTNATQATGEVSVDNTLPTGSISEPASGAVVADSVAVKGLCDDANFNYWRLSFGQGSAPAAWNFIYSGGTPVGQGGVPGLFSNWNAKSLANGDYVLRLEAWDVAGNKLTTNRPVKVGNDGPDITELTVTPSPFTPDGIDANITDDIANIAFYLLNSGFINVSVYDINMNLVKTIYNDSLSPVPESTDKIAFHWDGTGSNGRLARNGEYKVVVSSGSKEATAAVIVNDKPIFDRYKVEPQSFSPDGDGIGDTAKLTFSLSENSLIKVEVHNSEDVLVRTLADNALVSAGQLNEYVWDGKNNSGQIAGQGSYRFKVSATAVTGSEAAPLVMSVFLSSIPDVKVSKDTFNPHASETTDILYTLAYDAKLSIKIRNAQGNVIRELISGQARSVGDHSETWDGKDGSANILADGYYYFTIEDSVTGLNEVVYDPSTTGGYDISHSIVFSVSSFDTLKNEPAILSYTMPRPAKIDILIRKDKYEGPAIRSLKYEEPAGSGNYQCLWDGRDESGNILPYSNYTVSIWGYTLPDNSIVIIGGRPVISDVTTQPITFSPVFNPYAAQPQNSTIISFNLSQGANVTLDIYNSSNVLVRKLLDGVSKPAGVNTIVWDGKNEPGQIAPNDYYRVEIQAQKEDNYSDVVTAHTEVSY